MPPRVAPAPAPARLGLAGFLELTLLFLASCGQTMTGAECEKVGTHLRTVWDTEAATSLPSDLPKSDRAQNAIKAEGEKMQQEWLAQCKRELEGRKVDPREVECLLAAKTIDAIQQCQ
jgi:hypothetical protein